MGELRGRPKTAMPLIHRVDTRFDDPTYRRIKAFAEEHEWDLSRTYRHLVLIGLRETAGLSAQRPNPMERSE